MYPRLRTNAPLITRLPVTRMHIQVYIYLLGCRGCTVLWRLMPMLSDCVYWSPSRWRYCLTGPGVKHQFVLWSSIPSVWGKQMSRLLNGSRICGTWPWHSSNQLRMDNWAELAHNGRKQNDLDRTWYWMVLMDFLWSFVFIDLSRWIWSFILGTCDCLSALQIFGNPKWMRAPALHHLYWPWITSQLA